MNVAHVHLMLNHVPLFGALAVTILFVVALVLRQQGLARAGLVIALLTSLVSIVVYLTGEPAEELVENLPGVSEAVMETHEEVALIATLVLGAFALVALYGLFAFRHGVSMRFTKVLLVLSLLPLAAMAYTSYLGGQIRHSEIRPAQVGAPGANEGEGNERQGSLGSPFRRAGSRILLSGTLGLERAYGVSGGELVSGAGIHPGLPSTLIASARAACHRGRAEDPTRPIRPQWPTPAASSG